MKLLWELPVFLRGLCLIVPVVLADGDDIPLPSTDVLEAMTVTWSGTGCPGDSVTLEHLRPEVNYNTLSNPDGTYTEFYFASTDVIIHFDAFNVSIGPDIPTSENHKSCTFMFRHDAPGWKFGLQSVIWFSGYTQEEGVQQHILTRASMNPTLLEYPDAQWGPSMTFATDSIPSEGYPGTSNFAFSTDVWNMGSGEPLYSKCRDEPAPMRVENEVWLTSKVEESFGTNFVPEELPFRIELGLRWEKCE